MKLPAQMPPTGAEQIYVQRREPQMGATYFGENIQQENVPVEVVSQTLQDPVRYSDFSQVGRAPSEMHAGINIAIHENIAGISAVMEDEFLTGKVLPKRQTFMSNGNGGQLQWRERQNINQPIPVPYGDRLEIMAPQPGQFAGDAFGYGISYTPGRRV